MILALGRQFQQLLYVHPKNSDDFIGSRTLDFYDPGAVLLPCLFVVIASANRILLVPFIIVLTADCDDYFIIDPVQTEARCDVVSPAAGSSTNTHLEQGN